MAAGAINFVQEVYDAALDPRGVHVLADFLKARLNGGSVVVQHIAGSRTVAVTTVGVADQMTRRFLEYYDRINPLVPAALERVPIGRSALLSDFMPEAEYFRSEFFCDFAKAADTVWMVGAMIPLGPAQWLGLAVHRPLGDPVFTARDRARLQRLVGPIEAALRLRRRLDPTNGAGLAALETMAFGAVICDAAGRLVFVNSAAEALAADPGGIHLTSPEGVTAGVPGEAARLGELITEAGRHARAGAMAVTGSNGRRLFLLVTPLPRRFGQIGSQVLITMRPARRSPLADADTLLAVFEFTPAEARVAAALSTGAGAAEIARELGVSEETVRTHIKRLLNKTEVANQRELVALLAVLPPVKGSAPG